MANNIHMIKNRRVVTRQDFNNSRDVLFYDEDNRCAILDVTKDSEIVHQQPVGVIFKLDLIMARDRIHDPFNFKVIKSRHMPVMDDVRKELHNIFPQIDGESWSFSYIRNHSSYDSYHRIALKDEKDQMMMRLTYGL